MRGAGLAANRLEVSAAGLEPTQQRQRGAGAANPYAHDASSNHGSANPLLPRGLLHRGGGRQAGDVVTAPSTAAKQPRVPLAGPGDRVSTADGAGGAGRGVTETAGTRAKKSSVGGVLLPRSAAVVPAA